uniref:(northern house mosquito) hypothetical protein n=1 Tax=Culex pipiens TaxID=7175 RepID=A0A8D8AGY8_CULPI
MKRAEFCKLLFFFDEKLFYFYFEYAIRSDVSLTPNFHLIPISGRVGRWNDYCKSILLRIIIANQYNFFVERTVKGFSNIRDLENILEFSKLLILNFTYISKEAHDIS